MTDEWNYDLEAIPRGRPIMIRTTRNTRRVATVGGAERVSGRRIMTMTVVKHRRMAAVAWRFVRDDELESLHPEEAQSILAYKYFDKPRG